MLTKNSLGRSESAGIVIGSHDFVFGEGNDHIQQADWLLMSRDGSPDIGIIRLKEITGNACNF
jgi:hypothetical protein